MAKTIYTLLVLSLIIFNCTTTGKLVAESKYPEYTISQARLLVDTGKCELVVGLLGTMQEPYRGNPTRVILLIMEA